jgi:hypothetical protein
LTSTGRVFATGEVFQLTAKATQGRPSSGTLGLIEGLNVTFGSTTPGVTFAPGTSTTDSNGSAISFVVVPYGTQIVSVVSAGGAETEHLLRASQVPTVTLSPTLKSSGTTLPGGEVFELSTAVTLVGTTTRIEGLSVAFATTTAGVSFTPASNITDSRGNAPSYVVVPYGTEIVAVASGGGAAETFTLPASAVPTITLTPTFDPATWPSTGNVYAVKASAILLGAPSVDVDGLSIAFTLTNVVPMGTPGITPTTGTVLTDASGNATFSFFVPATVISITATVSGGGAFNYATLGP